MEKEGFSTFPRNSSEALALMYVHAQDIAKKQPEDLASLYDDALSRINAKLDDLHRSHQEKIHPPSRQTQSLFSI